MKYKNIFLNKNKKIIKIILFIFIVNVFFIPTKKVEAIWGIGDTVVEVGQNQYVNMLTSASTEISTYLQEELSMKEFVYDGMATAAVRSILKKMVSSTVEWINSGFEGSPAYITNFGGYMEDIGDGVIGDWIFGSKLKGLCSPFSLPVKLALIQNFTEEPDPNCTLSEITENISGAIDDLDRQWNWGTWNSITQNSNNNAYGSYIEISSLINNDVDNKLKEALEKLGWGSGFLSYEKCEEYDVGDGDTEKSCEIVTPGRTISDSLNKVLGAGQDSLVSADEINEIVGALLGQLMKKVIGPDGLLGSSKSSYSNSSYLEQLKKEQSELITFINKLVDSINSGIQREKKYIDVKKESFNYIKNAKNNITKLEKCYQKKGQEAELNTPSKKLWNDSGDYIDLDKIDLITQEILIATSTNYIESFDIKLTQEIKSSQKIIDTLFIIKREANQTTNITELNNLTNEYTKIQRDKKIHTRREILDAEFERDGTDVEGIAQLAPAIENSLIEQTQVCNDYYLKSEPYNF